jgi:hypothetical protein
MKRICSKKLLILIYANVTLAHVRIRQNLSWLHKQPLLAAISGKHKNEVNGNSFDT